MFQKIYRAAWPAAPAAATAPAMLRENMIIIAIAMIFKTIPATAIPRGRFFFFFPAKSTAPKIKPTIAGMRAK